MPELANLHRQLRPYLAHEEPELRQAANHLSLALKAVETRRMAAACKSIAEADSFMVKSSHEGVFGLGQVRDKIAQAIEELRPPTMAEMAERAKIEDKRAESIPFPFKEGEVDQFPPDLGYLKKKKKL
ncbi:Uncharacterised protein [Candidatus Norongarragalina meridionalis]|nr:Uncharacterised protein [Candidatus Norongarragalina meridionalis]